MLTQHYAGKPGEIGAMKEEGGIAGKTGREGRNRRLHYVGSLEGNQRGDDVDEVTCEVVGDCNGKKNGALGGK